MAAEPFVIAMPLIVTVAPVATWKTRTALLPLTMVLVVPSPEIVRLPLLARTGSALVSVIVPLALFAKVIVSLLTEELAREMASRSEQTATSQLPSMVSAALMTTTVCGSVVAGGVTDYYG